MAPIATEKSFHCDEELLLPRLIAKVCAVLVAFAAIWTLPEALIWALSATVNEAALLS